MHYSSYDSSHLKLLLVHLADHGSDSNKSDECYANWLSILSEDPILSDTNIETCKISDYSNGDYLH